MKYIEFVSTHTKSNKLADIQLVCLGVHSKADWVAPCQPKRKLKITKQKTGKGIGMLYTLL